MTIIYETALRNKAFADLSKLYEKTEFKGKTPERLAMVFGNSQYQAFAYDEAQLIGTCRAFSDGGDCAVICDVAIDPDYQGQGLGKQLLRCLLDQIPPHERIMLFSTQGLEPFYESFGFGKMTTGMCKFKNQQQAIETGLIR